MAECEKGKQNCDRTTKKLIEQKEESAKLVFSGEVKSLEFTGNVGDKGNSPNQDERDAQLKDIGKKLFKTHRLKSDSLFRIILRKKPKILSREEIDDLLTGEKLKKFRKLWTWELVISFGKNSFKISLPFKKYSCVTLGPATGALSEEDLALLLDDMEKTLQ